MILPRLLLLTFLSSLVVTVVLTANASSDDGPPPSTTAEPPAQGLAELQAAQREANYWQARWAQRGKLIRRQRAATRRLIYARPWGNHWVEVALACIHRHEGAWSSNTGNGYFGGLQMDRSFQRAYGPEFVRAFGTADRWPAAVQLAVGVRGWLRRGFGPWPNTARMCGLR